MTTTLFDQHGPIQWIGYDEAVDKYHVFPEAITYLQSLHRPVAIISVVGLYRTGKSYLLNRILDAPKGQSFQVSPTIKSCTKGLWIMRPPIRMDTHDILVVDTEGLGSLSASTNHDTRVFSLALLLSSQFLYNSCGAINETSLNNLSLVSSIAKHIHITADDYETTNNHDLSTCFPKFLWVARDFSLQIVDDEGKPTDATTYFNSALRIAPNSDPEEAKNKVRVAINDLFPVHKRQCVTMPRPCSEESKLQVLPDLDDTELRPEFVQALTQLKEIIFKECTPMSVPGQEGLIITGPLLATLCQTYVDAINSNKVPVIRDSWSLLSETECARAADKVRQEWRRFTESVDDELSIRDVSNLLETTMDNVLNMYDKIAVGSSASSGRESLMEEMQSQVSSILDAVRMRAKQRMRERLQKLQKKAIREASTVSDLIQLFEDDVDEEEPECWYPEAFPCLIRAVETFTNRTEKKLHELQRKVDQSELEMSTVKAEASAQVKEARIEAERLKEETVQVQEQLDTAMREIEDTKRRRDEREQQWKSMQEESAQCLEGLRQRISELESTTNNNTSSETTIDSKIADEHAQKVAQLTNELVEKNAEIIQIQEEHATLKKNHEEKNKEAQALLQEIAVLSPLKTELEDYKLKHDELTLALESTEQRAAEMEERHEEESQNIQKEAMDTVTAIRQVLAKERERCKLKQEETQKTLEDVREKALVHAKELEDRVEQAEKLSRQRQVAMEESKRMAAKERDTLRAEIERYAGLFKEQQESLQTSRKEWMVSMQDSQRQANDRERKLIEEKDRIRHTFDDTRRTLEMESATAKAQLNANERRRKSLEEDLQRMRERLGKSESTGASMARTQAELSMVREQKEKAQQETRTLSARVTMLERKMKETRRQCEMDKTKISMQYERQISVLESKLLS
jgi:hypothetical protein